MINRAYLEAERAKHSMCYCTTCRSQDERRCMQDDHPYPCADSQILDLALAAEEREQQFGNLLARIHRDGGHYISAYGWRKAGEDAEEIVLSDRTAAERAEGYRKALEKASAVVERWRSVKYDPESEGLALTIDEAFVECMRLCADELATALGGTQ